MLGLSYPFSQPYVLGGGLDSGKRYWPHVLQSEKSKGEFEFD